MKRFIQIYDMQKELDEYTFKKYNLSDKEDLKNKKLLGLIVEISELANKTQSFKYWSTKLPGTKEELLEEYADGLHFILSLCLELEINLNDKFNKIEKEDDISKLFLIIIKNTINLKEEFNKTNIKELLNYYIYLGECLGFSEGNIIEGYIKKNKINKERNDYDY